MKPNQLSQDSIGHKLPPSRIGCITMTKLKTKMVPCHLNPFSDIIFSDLLSLIELFVKKW